LGDIEQQALLENLKRDWASGLNWSSFPDRRTRVAAFQCPSDPGGNHIVPLQFTGAIVATTNYVGVIGRTYEQADGVFPGAIYGDGPRRFRDIRDGLSNTRAVACLSAPTARSICCLTKSTVRSLTR